MLIGNQSNTSIKISFYQCVNKTLRIKTGITQNFCSLVPWKRSEKWGYDLSAHSQRCGPGVGQAGDALCFLRGTKASAPWQSSLEVRHFAKPPGRKGRMPRVAPWLPPLVVDFISRGAGDWAQKSFIPESPRSAE